MGNFKEALMDDIKFINNTRRSTINAKNYVVSKEEYICDLKTIYTVKYIETDASYANEVKRKFIEKYGFWNWY